VGSPHPEPSTSFFIQDHDLVLRTQGAEWRFPEDAWVESWNSPWKDLSVEEIARIDPNQAAHHPVIEAIIAEYREMERMYGDRADILGTKAGTLSVHTPYTTAMQLVGEELLIIILTDPEATRTILDKIWEIQQAIFGRIAKVTGAMFNGIHLGDCSAAILSRKTYQEVVLPVNRRLASQFERSSYHSCGPSSHLVSDFASLPGLNYIELGPGTDLRKSTLHMPGVHIAPLVDPVLVREGNPDEVHEDVDRILTDTLASPRVTLCAWSFDRDTPVENVAQIYDTVSRQCGGG
jgi:uroporphyrinogen-III decarboxylase